MVPKGRTDGQGHLLSCSGQLKRINKVFIGSHDWSEPLTDLIPTRSKKTREGLLPLGVPVLMLQCYSVTYLRFTAPTAPVTYLRLGLLSKKLKVLLMRMMLKHDWGQDQTLVTNKISNLWIFLEKKLKNFWANQNHFIHFSIRSIHPCWVRLCFISGPDRQGEG